MDAITNAATFTAGKFVWTITNVVDNRQAPIPFVFGRLAKFAAEGHVTVVDTRTKSEVDAVAPNLVAASAPFVYLPKFSGIAYLHVWNEIQEDLFPRRFKSVIETSLGGFFVDCSIEPITDYRMFSEKLSALDRITEMTAKVHPPNPLFGRLWEPLKDYMEKRSASELALNEKEAGPQGLKSNIQVLIKNIVVNPSYQPQQHVDVTDAAMLMAADGYGAGKVQGKHQDADVVIKTSDTQKSFMFDKDPAPAGLAETAAKHLAQVSAERDMRHASPGGARIE